MAARLRGATGEASASRQETSVQNSNPSQNPLSYPSLLHDLLERAFLHARSASAGTAFNPGGIPHADVGDEPAGDDADIGADADTADDADGAAGRLELAELLGVMRERIEWVFTLAERRAQADPVATAAIHRVRDAVLHRINAIIVGARSAGLGGIRAADLLAVASLLVGAVDASVVQHAIRGVRSRLANALVALLQLDPSLGDERARAVAPNTGQNVPLPSTPACRGGLPQCPFERSACGLHRAYPSAPRGARSVRSLMGLLALRRAAPRWASTLPVAL